jgi:hypothetical protein
MGSIPLGFGLSSTLEAVSASRGSLVLVATHRHCIARPMLAARSGQGLGRRDQPSRIKESERPTARPSVMAASSRTSSRSRAFNGGENFSGWKSFGVGELQLAGPARLAAVGCGEQGALLRGRDLVVDRALLDHTAKGEPDARGALART